MIGCNSEISFDIKRLFGNSFLGNEFLQNKLTYDSALRIGQICTNSGIFFEDLMAKEPISLSDDVGHWQKWQKFSTQRFGLFCFCYMHGLERNSCHTVDNTKKKSDDVNALFSTRICIYHLV